MFTKAKKKAVAMILVLCMVISLMPTTVMAADGSYASRVAKQGETLYFDEGGKAVTEGDATVSISKTVEATNVENQFDITLNVNTKDKIINSESIVGADIVMVFDVSTSMDDNNRWSSLKTAADSFIDKTLTSDSKNRISIVVYGGSNDDNITTNHAILCGWSNDAAAVKATYAPYSHVSQSNASDGETSLRKAIFADNSTNYGATNCQAGFWAADEMLGSARDNALKYSVYMSDGSANRVYTVETGRELDCNHVHSDNCYGNCTHKHTDQCCSKKFPHNHSCNTKNCNHKHDNSCLSCTHKHTDKCYNITYANYVTSGNNVLALANSSPYSVPAAQAQASLLKTNHPDAKIFTIGFGTGSNAVLDPNHQNGNKAVDEFHEGTTENLTNIYDKISNQIILETNPWIVYDPMSDYVDLVSDSINGEQYSIDQDGNRIVWDLGAIVATNSEQKNFVLKYTVKLDMKNPQVWKDNAQHPTNDTTKLVYKITENSGSDSISHNAVTVNFDVPEVTSVLYTVKLEHYIDGVLDSSGKTFNELGGYEIDLDKEKLSKPYTQYVKRSVGDQDISNTETFIMNENNNDTIIRYDYKTGYPLTINYKAQGSNEVLHDVYNDVFKAGDNYGITSPIIPGYHLVSDTQATVSGTMGTQLLNIDVFYAKNQYKVNYEFNGTAPKGVNVPTDDKTYSHGDIVTVKEDPTYEGWTFNGWSQKQTFPITDNTTITGTWKINQYDLDVIYKFANDADLTSYQVARTVAVDKAVAEVDKAGIENQLTETAKLEYSNLSEDDKLANTEAEYIATYLTKHLDGAVEAAKEIARAAAGAAYDKDNLGSDIGTFHESYTAADGNIYENVFVSEAKAKHDHGYKYNFKAIDVPNYKETPTEAMGELKNNTTVLFSIANDLFSVTVNHYKMNRDGSFSDIPTEIERLPLKSGAEYDVTSKDYSGFIFDQTHQGGSTPGHYTMASEGAKDAVYNLYYNANKYNLDFNFVGSDNPSDISAPQEQSGLWLGDYATAPELTVPKGWTFDGWYTDKDNFNESTKYDFSTPIKGDVHLYGKWIRNTYKVEFTFTPANNVPETAVKPENQTAIKYEAVANAPSAIDGSKYNTKSEKYTFDGWYENADCTGAKFDFTSKITKDIQLYGKWTKDTQSYGYEIQHWNADTGKLMSTTTDVNPQLLDFGYIITDEQAKSYQYDTETLLKNFGNEYGEFTSATGCTIGATVKDNVVKCYYKAKSFNLKVNYVYENQEQAATPYSDTVKYGSDYKVESPSVPNYTPNVSIVEGTMPGNDVSVTVIYTENKKGSVTVNYIDATTNQLIKGVDTYSSSDYVGNNYSISSEFTTGKVIPNYTYAHRSGGNDSGTIADQGVVINVYFTHDKVNLVIKHVDASGNPANKSYFVESKSTVNTGEKYNASPLKTLPADYKIIGVDSKTVNDKGVAISDQTVTSDNYVVSGEATSKDSTVTITYTYGPKAKAYVTVNYKLLDKDNNFVSTLGSFNKDYKEGASYDVSKQILDTYGDKDQYIKCGQDGDSAQGKLNANDVKVVNVYYKAKQYPFMIKYIDDYNNRVIDTIKGDKLIADYGITLDSKIVAETLLNDAWINDKIPSNYNLGRIKYPVMSTTADKNIVEVHYSYTPSGGGSHDYYNVTVNYLEKGTDKVLDSAYTLNHLRGGVDYDVTDETNKTISGYSVDSIKGDSVKGIVNSDKVVNVYYTIIQDIAEPDVPLDQKPDNLPKDPDDVVNIDNPKVPLSNKPTTDKGDGVIIIDPNVPLGDLPKTGTVGDNIGTSGWVVNLMFSLILLSIAGMISTLSSRKEENDDK